MCPSKVRKATCSLGLDTQRGFGAPSLLLLLLELPLSRRVLVPVRRPLGNPLRLGGLSIHKAGYAVTRSAGTPRLWADGRFKKGHFTPPPPISQIFYFSLLLLVLYVFILFAMLSVQQINWKNSTAMSLSKEFWPGYSRYASSWIISEYFYFGYSE